MPIMQWLYFDALECLAEDEGVELTEEECTPVGVHSKSHTADRCTRMTALLKLLCFFSSFPRETVDTMGRLQCLAPSCRICLPNSAISW